MPGSDLGIAAAVPLGAGASGGAPRLLLPSTLQAAHDRSPGRRAGARRLPRRAPAPPRLQRATQRATQRQVWWAPQRAQQGGQQAQRGAPPEGRHIGVPQQLESLQAGPADGAQRGRLHVGLDRRQAEHLEAVWAVRAKVQPLQASRGPQQLPTRCQASCSREPHSHRTADSHTQTLVRS